jgi:hypothetical protein
VANKVLFCAAPDLHPAFPTLVSDLAMCQKDFTAHDDIYVTAKIAFPAAALAHWAGTPTFDSGYFITLIGGSHILSGLTLHNGSEWFDLTLLSTEVPWGASPLAMKWYIVEMWHKRSVERFCNVQCVNSTVGPAYSDQTFRINIGQWNALNPVVDPTDGRFHSVYFDKVWVGTTRFGNDILDEDWESGTFANWGFHNTWTGVKGCEIIDDPGITPYNTTCNPFDEPFREGVHLAPITIPYGNVPVGQVG